MIESLVLFGYSGAALRAVAEELRTSHGFEPYFLSKAVQDIAYDADPWIALAEVAGGNGQVATRFVRLRILVDDVGWQIALTNPEIAGELEKVRSSISTHLGFALAQPALKRFRDEATANAMAGVRELKPVFVGVRNQEETDLLVATTGAMVWRVERVGVGPLYQLGMKPLEIRSDASVMEGSDMAAQVEKALAE